jgi:hypothetical protein
VEMIEHFKTELERTLPRQGGEMTEGLGWQAINTVLKEQMPKSRADLLAPMRHALTGRRVSLQHLAENH